MSAPPASAFQPVPQAASQGLSQGPARSSVAKKGNAHKKQDNIQSAISKNPAPEETEDVYYSRTTGEKLNYLDTSAKSEFILIFLQIHSFQGDFVLQYMLSSLLIYRSGYSAYEHDIRIRIRYATNTNSILEARIRYSACANLILGFRKCLIFRIHSKCDLFSCGIKQIFSFISQTIKVVLKTKSQAVIYLEDSRVTQ